jgi:hypothetical protein
MESLGTIQYTGGVSNDDALNLLYWLDREYESKCYSPGAGDDNDLINFLVLLKAFASNAATYRTKLAFL